MSLWNLLPAGLAFALLQANLRFRDDQGLVRRLKDRDPHVMGDIYDRYSRLVYTLILRVVRNTGVAEDLAQETFMRIWNRGPSFDPARGVLGPWILTVARNRAIDYLRSVDGRIAAGSLEFDRLESPRLFARVEDQALSLDRGRKLKEAFRKLAPNLRLVLELAYYEGLSQTEMAAKLKQPLGTVKTWVRTALKILRDELTEAAIA